MLGYMLLRQNQKQNQKVDLKDNRNCDLRVLASCYSLILAVELINLSVTMLAKTVR